MVCPQTNSYRPLSWCIYFLSFLSVVSAQFQLSYPNTIVGCEPNKISWTGGSSPYDFFVHPVLNGVVSDNPPAIFRDIRDDHWVWNGDLAVGLPVKFRVVDAGGSTQWTPTFVIQQGAQTNCRLATTIPPSLFLTTNTPTQTTQAPAPPTTTANPPKDNPPTTQTTPSPNTTPTSDKTTDQAISGTQSRTDSSNQQTPNSASSSSSNTDAVTRSSANTLTTGPSPSSSEAAVAGGSTTSSNAAALGGSSHSSVGPIVGGVIGGLVVLAIFAVIIILTRRRRRQRELNEGRKALPFAGAYRDVEQSGGSGSSFGVRNRSETMNTMTEVTAMSPTDTHVSSSFTTYAAATALSANALDNGASARPLPVPIARSSLEKPPVPADTTFSPTDEEPPVRPGTIYSQAPSHTTATGTLNSTSALPDPEMMEAWRREIREEVRREMREQQAILGTLSEYTELESPPEYDYNQRRSRQSIQPGS